MLVLLGAAVGAVLLIACANLGSLLLAHSQARVREFAVRAAIGGAAGRIARQLMVESILLALLGGGRRVARADARQGPGRRLSNGPSQGGRDRAGRTRAAVALGTTLLTGLLAGLPLAAGRKTRRRARPATGRARPREQTTASSADGLIVGQVATSVALLFAGILLRTFVDMAAIKPGFDARNVIAFGTALSPARYPTPERQSAFYDALFDSLRAVPGVTAVGWAMFAPLGGGGWGDNFAREGSADAPPNLPSMQVKMVSPEYAQTLRISPRRPTVESHGPHGRS
jgi:hypothetical protein